jgi:hypothetical protein
LLTGVGVITVREWPPMTPPSSCRGGRYGPYTPLFMYAADAAEARGGNPAVKRLGTDRTGETGRYHDVRH